jgi:hypothetical protein
MLKLMSTGLSTAALIVGLVGCVDPGKAFDDFNDRAGTTDASTIDAPPSSLHNITGTFLVSVHAGFESSNDPTFYMQMLVDWTLTEATSSLVGTYTPLCTHSTCVTPRVMLPPAIQNTSTVSANGEFEQTIAGQLPGGANPISGTEQPFTGVLHAGIINADTVCGSVTGTVAGLDLTGSTFAAIRVTDTTPAALPAPVASCAN